MPLIKDGQIAKDSWVRATAGAPLPEADAVLLPYALWQESRDMLMAGNGRLGVVLGADQPPQLIAGDLDRLDLVALEFPVFKDGRAYSYAWLLRERYGYKKELRAVGHVLRDQFVFMHRCGFDSYEVADARLAQGWARALTEISQVYQPSADLRRPIAALRRERSAAFIAPVSRSAEAAGSSRQTS